MPIFKKKKDFPLNIFVFASLGTLIALPLMLFFFRLLVPADFGTGPADADINNPGLVAGDPFITKVPGASDKIKKPVLDGNDPGIGPKDARVVIVEYSDYQCAFCQKQDAVLKQIADKYENKVRIVWKNYPELDVYSTSWLAPIAARCADEQGKFWEFHNYLFQDSKNPNKDKFLAFAGKLKMDKEDFIECFDSLEAKKRIKDNIVEANALDISGVPFIYINGREIMGEISYEDLEGIMAEELN